MQQSRRGKSEQPRGGRSADRSQAKRRRSLSPCFLRPREPYTCKRPSSATAPTLIPTHPSPVEPINATGRRSDHREEQVGAKTEVDCIRGALSSECSRKRKRGCDSSDGTSIHTWLEQLPHQAETFDGMSQPPPKRARSRSTDSDDIVSSEGWTDSAVSRESKYSIYQDARYPVLLESQGSFMRDSDKGPLPEERAMCKRLFTMTAPVPTDPLFQQARFLRFLALLEHRSELRICIDLHPRLVPSAELLSLHDDQRFDDLIDGYNDRWNKAIVFYKKFPQPDRTVAFREAALTEQQRRKLGIMPETSSMFSAREGMCFPFLTCEVKCGKQALDLADRPNANSMTIAVRGVVDLYRRAGRAADIHRRILGFSISHDDKLVQIYGHYPEIDGESTRYYRHLFRSFDCRDKDGEERWTSYTFVYNVYTQFAPQHLAAIRTTINQLPDPLARSLDSTTTLEDAEETDSQGVESTPATSQQDMLFVKPAVPRGRTTVKQQLQQIQNETKVREQRFMAELEKQREEAKHRLAQQDQQNRGQLAQLEKLYKEQMAQQEKQMAQQEKQYKEQIAMMQLLLNQRGDTGKS